MKIAIVGGGPAGLCLALFLSRQQGFDISVLDQNPRDATYGFGVVLSERVLPQLLGETDVDFVDDLQRASFITRHQVIKHNDTSLFIEGGAYGSAIARIDLLKILQRHCERRGVVLRYEHRIDDPKTLDADLVVGADGVNSVVRRVLASEFGATSSTLTNRLAWYGTKQHFHYPLLAFKNTKVGSFVGAAYAYSESLSTFVAECDAQTWTRSGLSSMTEEERKAFTQRIFAEELGGNELLSNKSTWGSLLVTRAEHWSTGRYVLIGDALQSAHPTIGSGTRLAMDDAIALAKALVTHETDLPQALAQFRGRREPGKRKLIEACDRSIAWYETFGDKLAGLDPVNFVFDFMTRTGRIDERRLTEEYPRFIGRYAESWRSFSRHLNVDGVVQ